MTEDQAQSRPPAHWLRNILFVVLGLSVLFLASFLITGQSGLDSLWLLLLWLLPLFIH